MSVINQMLKDLDNRNSEGIANSTPSQNLAPSHSSIKIVLITAVTVLAVCSIALYVWQLNIENHALKEHNKNMLATNQVTSLKKTQNITADNVNLPAQEARSPAETAVKDDIQRQATLAVANVQKSPISKQRPKLTSESSSQPRKMSAPANNVQLLADKAIVNSDLSKVTPAEQDNQIVHSEDHSHTEDNVPNHSHNKAETEVTITNKTKPQAKPKTNAMSVSRRQLSADELAQQKLAHAEKALAAKQVSKAESLLEDVVIITPNDSQTRKKLAALWFGRQAYQDAVNLLSQGIALNAKDSSLRQMKARIHLKQGQVTAALNTLKPLAHLNDEQYQIMLANTAQQANHYQTAAEAYKMLIKMQPEMGRWQLGLAVLYDKNSQFDLATKAYKTALIKNDLSVSSEQFVKERIQAIGQ